MEFQVDLPRPDGQVVNGQALDADGQRRTLDVYLARGAVDAQP